MPDPSAIPVLSTWNALGLLVVLVVGLSEISDAGQESSTTVLGTCSWASPPRRSAPGSRSLWATGWCSGLRD